MKNKKNNNKKIAAAAKSFIDEFKKFIMRGNVLDLAIGVIIGGAFGKIVTSLVNDILMPLIGMVLGGLNFTTLSIKIGDANILYGAFIQQIIDFVIIAFCIFMIVKFVNRISVKPKKEEKPNVIPEDIKLLTEIRDLLKK